jgi:hypothetical protein
MMPFQLLVPLLEPQVLFFFGKFMVCGFCGKEKMIRPMKGPLAGPQAGWQDLLWFVWESGSLVLL